MKKIYVLIVLIILSIPAFTQSLSVPELISYLDMPAKQIDTVLMKKGYRLIKKEVDSSSGIYNYSSIQVNEGTEPTWVRSVNYMDVQVKNVKSRLLTYRTYSGEDYRRILQDLLNANFRSTHKFDFKEAKHTLYEKDGRSIRLKVIDEKLPNGKMIKVYEVETGR